MPRVPVQGTEVDLLGGEDRTQRCPMLVDQLRRAHMHAHQSGLRYTRVGVCTGAAVARGK